MSTSVKEIAWVAGILEGEAWFDLNYDNPRISIQMTDLDIIEKLRNIINKDISINTYSDDRFENRKDSYRVSFNGSLAVSWIMTIYPLMGLRRKTKIRELLQYWKTARTRRAYGSRKRTVSHNYKSNLEKLGLTEAQVEQKLLEIMMEKETKS